MRLVLIESPYAGTPDEVRVNVEYAKALVRDALTHGEAPYASHLFFTQDGLLLDTVPEQRKLGIEAGLAWGAAASLSVVGVDRGISSGMIYGIESAIRWNRPIEMRSLQSWNTDMQAVLATVDALQARFPKGLDGVPFVYRRG